ncbi:MAG: hypothetical protein J6Y53_02585 [Alphaproteobacteria bacterium]|nr:hypothetical protein [Alphaproteobacteria bacterium]
MKKILCFVAALLFAQNAFAETVIVIDDNGYVRSTPQIITSPTVVTTQPTVTVVRETPVQNSYYYDRNATGTAIAAGITTAVVGSLLFGGISHHHHHHHRPAPAPILRGGSHHGAPHHGGHRR